MLVLDVFGLKGKDAEEWWSSFTGEVAETIARKMSLGDAVLLREAENYGTEAIITWNIKDFHRRTRLTVLTPTAFLKSNELARCTRSRRRRENRTSVIIGVRERSRYSLH